MINKKKIVLQEYSPLHSSIEWQLGQRFYLNQGNKAFRGSGSGKVPYVVNNDGQLSRKSAQLFFYHLESKCNEIFSDQPIFVIELGVGVCLFAKFFLDEMRELCLKNGKAYYQQLCYVATDKSEQMLSDACRHGVFSDHCGHYVFRVVDANDPLASLAKEFLVPEFGQKPFAAVFLNYVLDCLPAAVLHVDDSSLSQLCVRTSLTSGLDLRNYTYLYIQGIVLLANSKDPKAVEQLGSLYHLFLSEFVYQPVEADQIPYASG